MEQAESVASTHGIPISEVIDMALAQDLQAVTPPPVPRSPRRVDFPIFKSANPGVLNLTK